MDIFLYFQVAANFLSLSFIISFSLLLIISWFLQTSQDLDLVTPMLTNYFRLLMIKAFGKVWHEGLLLKLFLNGIFGKTWKLLADFLDCCKQRVVLNGQHSSWENVNAEVPQGSILSPLLFLIYISDLSNGVS